MSVRVKLTCLGCVHCTVHYLNHPVGAGRADGETGAKNRNCLKKQSCSPTPPFGSEQCSASPKSPCEAAETQEARETSICEVNWNLPSFTVPVGNLKFDKVSVQPMAMELM